MASFNVNNDAAIELTAKLEKLHRSAFPSAVRNTLNDAAFGMKKGILISAKKNFNTVRSPSFFKRYTKVEKASGWDVNRLSSAVGFSNASDPSVRRVVEGLRKQEFGGIIDDGARYLRGSRTGKSNSKRVKKGNYYDRNKVISGRSKSKGTRKSKFVSRMYRSKKENKPFFMNTMKGNFLVEVKTLRKNKKNGKVNAKLKFLMMSRDKSPATIRRTRFMTEAAMVERKKMIGYYKSNANFQINKLMKK